MAWWWPFGRRGNGTDTRGEQPVGPGESPIVTQSDRDLDTDEPRGLAGLRPGPEGTGASLLRTVARPIAESGWSGPSLARDAGRFGQRRMAAREQQPQHVVANARRFWHRFWVVQQVSHGGLLLGTPVCFASQPVERRVASHRCQPGRRIVGDPSVGPDLERADHGVVHRVLGQLERPEPPGEGGHDAATLTADDIGQQLLVHGVGVNLPG